MCLKLIPMWLTSVPMCFGRIVIMKSKANWCSGRSDIEPQWGVGVSEMAGGVSEMRRMSELDEGVSEMIGESETAGDVSGIRGVNGMYVSVKADTTE